MSSWRKFRQLSWSERWLLAQALLLLPLSVLAIRLIGLRRWQSALANLNQTTEDWGTGRLSSTDFSLWMRGQHKLKSVPLCTNLGQFDLAPIDKIPGVDPVESLVQQAHVTARMVKIAAWHGLYRANCLPQSLVLWWLLRRQRIKSELRIGVRKERDQFEAHAWVEFMGHVLSDSDDVHQRYVPFNYDLALMEVESL